MKQKNPQKTVICNDAQILLVEVFKTYIDAQL